MRSIVRSVALNSNTRITYEVNNEIHLNSTTEMVSIGPLVSLKFEKTRPLL